MNVLKDPKFKRFDRPYERLLYTRYLRLTLGLVFIALVVSALLPVNAEMVMGYSTVFNSLLLVAVFYIVTDIIISIMSKYPAVHGFKYVFPVGLSAGVAIGVAIIGFSYRVLAPLSYGWAECCVLLSDTVELCYQ